MPDITPEQLESICDKLAVGQSLRAICRELELAESTVRRHFNASDDNMAQYARARDLQADAFFDDIVDLADKTSDKALEDREDRRLQIEARKWAAGKLKGKYSDRALIEHSGPGGGAFIVETGVCRAGDPED